MKNGVIINNFGTKEYYMNDLLHREDGPAEVWANGSKFWHLHGERHRVDGPAEEWADGTKIWLLHDKLHREAGPAVEYEDGTKSWYLNGKRHRIYGPAIKWSDGTASWWINDKRLIHPEEFKTMEAWFEQLNADQEYSLPWIHDINGLIALIKNPTDKQKRLNAIKWKI